VIKIEDNKDWSEDLFGRLAEDIKQGIVGRWRQKIVGSNKKTVHFLTIPCTHLLIIF